MKQVNKEDEIEAALKSLDKIERAETHSLFFNRLQQKMAANKPATSYDFLWMQSRPVFAIAALFIFILLNGIAISNVWEQKHRSTTSPVSLLKSFANDYDLGTSTVYEQ